MTSIEPLPRHPNLEHQQKLARRLLRDAWAGKPDAIARVRAFLPHATNFESLKLHDTQLVVARGYGFDSWAAMKRRIESLTKSPIELFDIAVREGDVERVRELLEKDAYVAAHINDPRFDFNSPALHQAKHNIPLVDVLLAHGADIAARSTWWAGSFGILEHAVNDEQAKPLIERGAPITAWAAASLGMLNELKAIVAAQPDVVRERGGDGKTVLHCASSREIVEFLVDHGADLDARDVDHASTPLQYLIADEYLARLLIERGARADIFAAARLGDRALVERCLSEDPKALDCRVNQPPFSGPGLHIYGWTLGFDLTPIDVARKFGHTDLAREMLSRLSKESQLIDALWTGDRARTEALLAQQPDLAKQLAPTHSSLLPMAAWWYRPEAVRLMLEVGFDPHTRGVHQSMPLDRAAFHGYADIVQMLLTLDPHPPLTERNEFGGIPLGACLYGSMNGWDTGFPRDHARTVQLLLEQARRWIPPSFPPATTRWTGYCEHGSAITRTRSPQRRLRSASRGAPGVRPRQAPRPSGLRG